MNNINSAGLLRGSAFALALMLSVGSAAAQDYPSRPVTAIVPFAGGSASDVVSRILFDKMSKLMGQPIAVPMLPPAPRQRPTATPLWEADPVRSRPM